MGFIPEEKINEIRDRANIVSVISQYLSLKRAGVNYKANCPFHTEKTASFVVSEAKNIYHCFGCGKGGNVFSFLMEQAGLSFPEAVQKLSDELGIELSPLKPYDRKHNREKKELFYKLNKTTLLFFKDHLKKSREAQRFLVERGLNPATTSRYHLGFVLDQWHSLGDYCKQRQIPSTYLIELGLLVQKPGSNRTYDRFRNRIMFPLFDLNQRVLGFGGRSLDKEAIPKYLNSSESPIYQKSKGLYGLSFAVREGVQKLASSGIIIVEGYFDCLLLIQAGFQNVVATMGTALTQEHVDLLRRFTDRYFLLFDADEAGKEAAERALPIFLRSNVHARIVELPSGLDPDDFIRTYGKSALLEKIANSRFLIDFVLERWMGELDDVFSSKSKIVEKIVPFLRHIPEGIEREEWVKRVSDRLQIDEKWILRPLSEHKSDQPRTPGVRAVQDRSSWDSMRLESVAVEIELIEFLMLFAPWLKDPATEKMLDFFTDLEVKTIGLEMISQYQQMGKVDLSSLLEKIKSENLKQVFRRGVLNKESQNLSESEWRRVFEDCKKRIYRNHLESIEKSLLLQIKSCEEKGSKEVEKVDLLNRYQQIVKQKQEVK